MKISDEYQNKYPLPPPAQWRDESKQLWAGLDDGANDCAYAWVRRDFGKIKVVFRDGPDVIVSSEQEALDLMYNSFLMGLYLGD